MLPEYLILHLDLFLCLHISFYISNALSATRVTSLGFVCAMNPEESFQAATPRHSPAPPAPREADPASLWQRDVPSAQQHFYVLCCWVLSLVVPGQQNRSAKLPSLPALLLWGGVQIIAAIFSSLQSINEHTLFEPFLNAVWCPA